MELAVIIPNLNSPIIDKVIEAVLSQIASISGEIWVVGQDRYNKIPTSPFVHSIYTPIPLFPGSARNLGASQTRSDVYIFLDADCIPQPGWLEALLRTWEVHPDAGAISGAMLPHSDTFIQHCEQIANFHEYLNINPHSERDALASFSLLVPGMVWQTSGGFSSSLFPAEDIDFSLRLKKMGWKLFFTPKALVYHRHQRVNIKAYICHAHRSGKYSIQMRLQHPEKYTIPIWLRVGWSWYLGSPLISAMRTLQIYINTPGLYKYIHCLPWVYLHKMAWCFGAANELNHASKKRKNMHEPKD